MEKRIMAFDIGDKRVGVAVTDPFNSYAMPLDTYFRTGKFAEDIKALAKLAEGEGVGKIVCGLPLNADGTESIQTEKTRRFVEALKRETHIPVETEDERYTTREARRDLTHLGVSTMKDKRKKAVDSIAAAYILESYLEKIKREIKNMSMKEENNDYEEENNVVELVDEDGEKHEYEHLMTFEFRGEWYVALAPTAPIEEADEDEGEEIAIFHLVGGEDDEQLEVIEDEQLLDDVFEEFCKLYEDFEDDESDEG